MSDSTTLDATGVFTRWGHDVAEIIGFGHETLDGLNDWDRAKDGRLAGQWWVELRLVDEDFTREYMMDALVHDALDDVGRKNMDAISQACMAYLTEHGEWSKCGKWIPTK